MGKRKGSAEKKKGILSDACLLTDAWKLLLVAKDEPKEATVGISHKSNCSPDRHLLELDYGRHPDVGIGMEDFLVATEVPGEFLHLHNYHEVPGFGGNYFSYIVHRNLHGSNVVKTFDTTELQCLFARTVNVGGAPWQGIGAILTVRGDWEDNEDFTIPVHCDYFYILTHFYFSFCNECETGIFDRFP